MAVVDHGDYRDYVPSGEFAENERRRITKARWWVLAAGSYGLLLIDRDTIRSEGSNRIGWSQIAVGRHENGGGRIMTLNTWNCDRRTVAATETVAYTSDGRMASKSNRAEAPTAVIPDTNEEAALKFVCGGLQRWGELPAPLMRDPVSAADVYFAYAGREADIQLGVMLATRDPIVDRDELKSLLKIVQSPARRLAVETALWKGP